MKHSLLKSTLSFDDIQKETWPDEKLAYYGMEALDRMLKNCPIKVRGIYSNERDAKLEDMRKWVKYNRKSLVINKNSW